MFDFDRYINEPYFSCRFQNSLTFFTTLPKIQTLNGTEGIFGFVLLLSSSSNHVTPVTMTVPITVRMSLVDAHVSKIWIVCQKYAQDMKKLRKEGVFQNFAIFLDVFGCSSHSFQLASLNQGSNESQEVVEQKRYASHQNQSGSVIINFSNRENQRYRCS